jgi:hypoxanthine-guanine phosphoribosyltransferase
MIRHSDIVEDAVQLVDDIVDLGGQVTRVDRHSEGDEEQVASSFVSLVQKYRNRTQKGDSSPAKKEWLLLQRAV